jgi:protein TonB
MERITRYNEAAIAVAGRIGLALLVSAAAHLLLVAKVEISGPRSDAPPPSIRARLDLPPAPATPSAPPIRRPVPGLPAPVSADAAPPAVIEEQAAAPPVVIEQPPVAYPAEPAALEAPAAVAPDPETVSVPVDPAYYAARELDVYPVPLQPLRVQLVSQIQGWVRVLTLVDETGSVTQAEIFDSDPPEALDEAALAAVRASRFSPARKDGRTVRSRILLELAFMPGARP